MKQINWRAFISLLSFFSLLTLPFAGYAVHVITRDCGGYGGFWGMTKFGWMSLHNVFGVILAAGVIFHLYFNWKAFRRHLVSRECALALAVFLPLLVFLIAHGMHPH